MFGLNLYHCAVLLVSSLCASTVARTKIFKNKLKIVMCGVSPENYSQMEVMNHDDDLVDNNQNQNLKLVKHTLRNQVCDFVFSSKFSSWETQFLWNLQFVLTAHSFAHTHWSKIKIFVQFFKNSYWQWQKNSRLWIFAPKLLNLKFYNAHIQIQFGWKLPKRKKVFWAKIWILVQCVSCR